MQFCHNSCPNKNPNLVYQNTNQKNERKETSQFQCIHNSITFHQISYNKLEMAEHIWIIMNDINRKTRPCKPIYKGTVKSPIHKNMKQR